MVMSQCQPTPSSHILMSALLPSVISDTVTPSCPALTPFSAIPHHLTTPAPTLKPFPTFPISLAGYMPAHFHLFPARLFFCASTFRLPFYPLLPSSLLDFGSQILPLFWISLPVFLCLPGFDFCLSPTMSKHGLLLHVIGI